MTTPEFGDNPEAHSFLDNELALAIIESTQDQLGFSADGSGLVEGILKPSEDEQARSDFLRAFAAEKGEDGTEHDIDSLALDAAGNLRLGQEDDKDIGYMQYLLYPSTNPYGNREPLFVFTVVNHEPGLYVFAKSKTWMWFGNENRSVEPGSNEEALIKSIYALFLQTNSGGSEN